MWKEDTGITNPGEMKDAIMWAFDKADEIRANDPITRRAEKVADRYLRFVLANAEVGDLPTGARMKWVNHLTKELAGIMRSDMPLPRIEKMCDRIIMRELKELHKFMKRAHTIQEGLRPAAV